MEPILYFLILIIFILAAALYNRTREIAVFKKSVTRLEDENRNIRGALSSLDEVDEINQIYTFKYFHHLVEREIERAERYNNRFSLLFIETSNFRELSAEKQDILFRNVMDIIKSNIRLVDICFQNEANFSFALVLTETDPSQARKITQRIYNSICRLNQDGFVPEVFMGIVCYPNDGTLRRNLVEKSKYCLEEAQKLKENKIFMYSDGSED